MDISLFLTIFHKASIVVKFIMFLLLILSITSWTLIFNRFIVIGGISRKDKQFYKKFYSNYKFSELSQEVNAQKNPVGLARIFKQGLLAYQQSKAIQSQTPEAVIDLINKKVNTTIVDELETQDTGLNVLSIITGIAPYIGLFGTVWGIIEVFTSLGTAEQVNIQIIAPGISEALVATAMGLFVAIPALVFYNVFHRKVMFNENQYYNFQDQFATVIQDDIYRRLGQTAQVNQATAMPSYDQAPPTATPTAPKPFTTTNH